MQLIHADLTAHTAGPQDAPHVQDKVKQSATAQVHKLERKKTGQYDRAAESVCLLVDPKSHREQCANTDQKNRQEEKQQTSSQCVCVCVRELLLRLISNVCKDKTTVSLIDRHSAIE